MDVTPYRPGERSWHNTTPVRQPDPKRTRWLWWLLTGAVTAFTPVLLYLNFHIRYTKFSHHAEDVRAVTDRARQIERHLYLERAALETLPRAERAARRLGLTPPRPDSVVMVRIGSPAPRNLMARAPDDDRDAH
jgi:hypothetical protein